MCSDATLHAVIEHVSYGKLPDQYGELRTPPDAGERPLVILIHGGFWRDQYRCDLMHPLAGALSDRGYSSWNIEYRRVGPSGGGYPTTLHDVATAIDHMTERGWSSIAVIGHSAGGHLALWNASRSEAPIRPDLTVGLAPVADVIAANRTEVGKDATANFFGGDVDDVPDSYRAGQPTPTEFSGRIVLLHGDNDDSVPLAQSHTIADHVDRFDVLADTDHLDVIDPTHVTWNIVFDELAELTTKD